MKFKFIPIVLCLLMLVSCVKVKEQKSEKIADTPNTTSLQNKIITTPSSSNRADESPSVSQNNKNLDNQEVFNLIFSKKIDLNGDGKIDDLGVYIDKTNLLTKFHVNNFEKVFDFAYTESGSEEVKLISLGKNRRAILVGTSIDVRDTSNHVSFKIFQYNGNEIAPIIYDSDLQINSKGNYKVNYLESGYINFKDNATGFVAEYKYPPKNIKFSEVTKKKLEKFDELNIENSIYPCLVKVQDMDSDGIDEIIYSKYIPGVMYSDSQDDALGIIEYTFKYNNGQFRLEKETLRDWWSGLDVIKQMKVN